MPCYSLTIQPNHPLFSSHSSLSLTSTPLNSTSIFPKSLSLYESSPPLLFPPSFCPSSLVLLSSPSSSLRESKQSFRLPLLVCWSIGHSHLLYLVLFFLLFYLVSLFLHSFILLSFHNFAIQYPTIINNSNLSINFSIVIIQ